MDSRVGGNLIREADVQIELTVEQAQILVAAMQRAKQEQAAAEHVLHILTVGRVPAGAILQDINTDNGMLTFATPDP